MLQLRELSRAPWSPLLLIGDAVIIIMTCHYRIEVDYRACGRSLPYLDCLNRLEPAATHEVD